MRVRKITIRATTQACQCRALFHTTQHVKRMLLFVIQHVFLKAASPKTEFELALSLNSSRRSRTPAYRSEQCMTEERDISQYRNSSQAQMKFNMWTKLEKVGFFISYPCFAILNVTLKMRKIWLKGVKFTIKARNLPPSAVSVHQNIKLSLILGRCKQMGTKREDGMISIVFCKTSMTLWNSHPCYQSFFTSPSL